ncbi:alpha/beta hydrolase [Congregibacter sp.]|uniref:alpha/beta hydrolase n=1 Tax=Congregibacter sp. TaxID=2744308 RepID=UPI003F6C1301
MKTSTCQTVFNRLFTRLFTRLLTLTFLCFGATTIVAEEVQLDDQEPVLSGRLLRSDSWPGGDVALLLHGTLSHRDTEIIQALEILLGDEGVSTLAINLSLGIDNRAGAFACDSVHRHREDDASTELARWSRWLAGQGVEKITAVGHSRGANQLARYAKDGADPNITRLVLIAPPQWSWDATRTSYETRHNSSLEEVLAEAETRVAAGEGDTPMPGKVGLLYCDNTRATAASFVSYYRRDPLRDTPTVLARLSLPVLVVAGSDDQIASGLPIAMAERAPTVTVEEIEGADHFFRDLYADELVEIAIDFMHSDQ